MKETIITIISVILAIAVIVLAVYPYVFGNKEFGDFKQEYDYAILQRADGEQKIEIVSWRDYDGEQIQITDTDGTTYLVNSMNVILVGEGE